jgi:hypothetical protein
MENLIPIPIAGATNVKWAYNLMQREANGEKLDTASVESWRKALNIGLKVKAKDVLNAMTQLNNRSQM